MKWALRCRICLLRTSADVKGSSSADSGWCGAGGDRLSGPRRVSPRRSPMAVYDVGNEEGWVRVGDTADTAEFAVESIRRWWNTLATTRFSNATTLMITADAGGSHGYPGPSLEV